MTSAAVDTRLKEAAEHRRGKRPDKAPVILTQASTPTEWLNRIANSRTASQLEEIAIAMDPACRFVLAGAINTAEAIYIESIRAVKNRDDLLTQAFVDRDLAAYYAISSGGADDRQVVHALG